VDHWFAGGATRGCRVMDFITTFCNGKSLLLVGRLLMFSRTSSPSRTCPKTVYFPSSFGRGVRQT